MSVEAGQGSRLASLCPGDTAANLAFTATLDTEITRLLVTNLTAGALTFRIWHVAAADSPTQPPESALYYDHAVAANDTFELRSDATNSGIQLKVDDELWIRSSSASALAFNLYGVTASIATAG